MFPVTAVCSLRYVAIAFFISGTLHTMLKDAFKKIGRLENKLKATKYSSVVNKVSHLF